MEKKQKDTEGIRNNGAELNTVVLILKRGKITFQICVQFSPEYRETLEEKLKRLQGKEVKIIKSVS